MATVEYGLADGLRYAEDPRTGQITYTVGAYCKDLDPVGGLSPFGTPGEELALINQALLMVPPRLTPGPIAGTVLLNHEPVVDKDFPQDCTILLHFGVAAPGTAGGTVRIRVGTTTQQTESEFDAANRALPFTSRVPIAVRYRAGSNTVPAAPAAPAVDQYAQGGRLPWYAQNSTITYTRNNNYDPSGESRTYAGKRNSVVWKGLAIGSVLCLEIFGESTDGGLTYITDYAFAYDPDLLWMQFLRWTDPLTGQPPKLSATQVSNRNGIQDEDMQGSADFNALGL